MLRTLSYTEYNYYARYLETMDQIQKLLSEFV